MKSNADVFMDLARAGVESIERRGADDKNIALVLTNLYRAVAAHLLETGDQKLETGGDAEPATAGESIAGKRRRG